MRRPPFTITIEDSGYERLRTTRLSEAEDRLQTSLILFNLVVLGAGATISYFAARRTIRPIEEALEAQSRFTADASHELRTPLTTIQTETQVALRDTQAKPTELRAQLESNLEEVGKLRALIDGLLRLARKDNDKTNELIQLDEIVESAVGSAKKNAKQKNIIVTSSLLKTKVHGDADNIAELMKILLDNAIKYAPEKSSIHVSMHKSTRHIVVSVDDQGPGIHTKDLPFIFERFYRGDSSRNKSTHGGYGLGLSIAQQIVASHHGSIYAENTAKGARFTFKLPKILNLK